ncbi:MAG: hypothetical protein IKF71_03870 [Bacilli bacterium]|nr:hypothetical protein [Bacilli bacterium]
MKKIIIAVLVLLGTIVPVKAADYNIRELIPEGIKTTVRGDRFNYSDILYQSGMITIGKVRNNREETYNFSISIGLFDKSGVNIGTINYCPENTPIESRKTISDITIDVKGSYLEKGKNYKDIHYISVIGENTNCRKDGALENIGQTVDQIGMPKNNTLDDNQIMLLNIVKFVAIALVALFLYRFLFTSAYRNMDGTDVRQEYAYINKELEKEREIDAVLNPPKPKVIKTHKTKEILKQEKEQNTQKSKDETDLFNMYK